VVLIIDEAQNLSAEALEQVRLLTNLETATQKLLQIILLGQPELRDLLARPELRQLAQRITARFHLTPLDVDETAAYLRHRSAWPAASVSRSPGWRAPMHTHAGGVPRLINVIAERALLAGYAEQSLARLADCGGAGNATLNCFRANGPLTRIAALDRPVMLRLRREGGFASALLTALDEQRVTLFLGGESVTVPRGLLELHWLGDYRVLWRGAAELPPRLRLGDSGPGVLWLRERLALAEVQQGLDGQAEVTRGLRCRPRPPPATAAAAARASWPTASPGRKHRWRSPAMISEGPRLARP
jgi:hypothetical protein